MIDDKGVSHEYSESNPSQEPQYDEAFLAEGPQVSSPARKSMALIVVFVAVLGILLFNLLSGDDEEEETKAPPRKVVLARRETIPAPPTRIETPVAPPIAPRRSSLSDKTSKSPFTLRDSQPLESARSERLSSSLMIVNKASSFGGVRSSRQKSPYANDGNSEFENVVYSSTQAEKAYATNIGDLGLTVAQGKVIDATLETAINTDLPGMLRAIVSRDVYAEQGRNILLPKGSRLIGTYNTGISRGQRRVFIIWTRAIRPDGVDIQVNSPGTDALGRAGVEGIVDNKYFEIFTGALLTSTLTFGVGLAAESILGDDAQISSYVNSTGQQVTEGDPSALAAMEAAQVLASTGKDLVGSLLSTQPTITIHQGERIKVFVKRDLIFPSEFNEQSVRFIK